MDSFQAANIDRFEQTAPSLTRAGATLPAVRPAIASTLLSVEQPACQQPDRRSSSLHDAGLSHPLLYLSGYCSLDQNALDALIGKSLTLLKTELGPRAAPATEAIIFYYLWHEEAAMVDIALPAANALERRPNNLMRGTVLPETGRWTRPQGGIGGLKAARRQLAERGGIDPADPLFRVWQSVPLNHGALPANWLETPLEAAV